MNINNADLPPLPEEFIALRAKAGLSAKSLKAAKTGLVNSLYADSIRDQDGACNFEIVDIAVDPDFQGSEIGRQIMNQIETYLPSVVLEGSYVSLIADQPVFYEKPGYPYTAPNARGMTKEFTPTV
ncbi:MAG: hypothetical protein CENE_02804 [Candidatus Celerinatantimonas neptuna]|nr:MAG: hypothetical protein CENE_02804 [Candidatus Celerinatantimonas neptuna]